MKIIHFFLSCIYTFLPIQAWLLAPPLRHINHQHSYDRARRHRKYHVQAAERSICRYRRSSRFILQATAKDISPAAAAKLKATAAESSSSPDPFVVVKAFTNLFPKDNTTTSTKEVRPVDEGRGFPFPRISLFSKSQDDDKETPAVAKETSSKTSFFRNLWNRTRNDSNETLSRDEAERQRREKESERVRKYKQDKQEQKQKLAKEKRQQKQQAKQNADEQPSFDDQDESSSFAWPLAMLSKVQSSAMGLFNSTTSSSNNATTNNTSNTNSSNPFSTVQKFWASSASLISSATTSITSGGNSNNKEEWITVFPKTRLMPGVIVPVTIAGGLDLLVIASKDGRRLYAIENSCPHLGTPLETGQLVRLPVEESPSPATAAAGASGATRGPFSAQQQQQSSSSSSSDSSSFQSKLTGAFNGPWSESEVSKILQQDGCEDCIVCPLHRTAFALQSGNVRGEWCPYPPILGKLIGNVKAPTGVAVFDVRTRGKNVEIRINTPILMEDDDKV